MDITPINDAEAIIEPFWDPAQSELAHWTIEPGGSHGLVVRQGWCWVAFEWARRPAVGPALRMRRDCGIACADYDRLVLSINAPPAAVVHLHAETDRGWCRLEAPPAVGGTKRELALDLRGATRLETIVIEIAAGAEGISLGWLNWLGLQHTGRLTHKLKAQAAYEPRWEKHLHDASFQPRFEPVYGLVLNAGDLDVLRQRHDAMMAAGRRSPFLAAAEQARRTPPEPMIHDFVNFWGDSRYNRERDQGKFIQNHGLNAAIAGLLTHDKELLRLAARYALSIGMCKHWDDGFPCRFPGGTFDHRCFVQSLCAYEVAGILDLAGECFTDLGRDFLLRRLAEEALGAIQYNTWKYEYIFRCNQLAWFTPARMLSLGVLARHSPRVRPYLDIAYRELCESLDATILPDGGYVEGPTYFRCVGRDAGLGLYHYSRAIGKPMVELIPDAMKRCADLGELVISTDACQDVIAFCDASPLHDFLSQSVMAALLPGSAWTRMQRACLARNEGWPFNAVYGPENYPPIMIDAAIAWGLVEPESAAPAEPRPFVVLPDMGPVASQRRFGDHWVKLLIQGNKAWAGHAHEDKGSFVLEFAGDTFAMDPGTADYSHPLAAMLQQCERHNMLVPFGFKERPAPQSPLPHDVKPVGAGDDKAFHAEIDATPGWEPYYRRWRRVWHSPAPDALAITDDYELAAGEGVEFSWQTRLPVAVDGNRAVITGRVGRAELEAPDGCAWRVDELPLVEGVQRRLAFAKAGTCGRFTVQVRLQVART